MIVYVITALLGSVASLFAPSKIQEVRIQKGPHIFTENKGQWDPQVLYKADFGTTKLYVEDHGFLWDIRHPEDMRKYSRANHTHGNGMSVDTHEHANIPKTYRRSVIKMSYLESNSLSVAVPLGASESYKNFYIGKDKSKWASYVRDYRAILSKDLYRNIDFLFTTDENKIKYDLIVQPGGRVSDIKMEVEGAENIYIENGALHVRHSFDEIIERKPFAYQEIGDSRIEVPCSFIVNDNIISYSVGTYNKNYPLVIDPELVFCSFSGSSADNWGSTATPGKNGELYGAGIVSSQGDYPVTTGSYDEAHNGGAWDISISKFNADGTELVFSTLLGGAHSDFPTSIIELPSGELAMTGVTSSTDYPTTTGAIQDQFNDVNPTAMDAISGVPTLGSDLIITVFNPEGSELVGSTYLGGSEHDGIVLMDDPSLVSQVTPNYGDNFRSEIIHHNGDLIISASVRSSDFPTTSGVYSSNYNGGLYDAVVAKLNKECNNLISSTFLGGNAIDLGLSLKTTQAGEVYITGGTMSQNFPTTSGVYEESHNGGIDGYVSKLSADFSTLTASTFYGSLATDISYLIDLDIYEKPNIFGISFGGVSKTSGTYGYDRRNNFITRFNSDLTATEFEAPFGSNDRKKYLSPTAFLVDNCNRIMLACWGGVTNGFTQINATDALDVSSDAFQSQTDGSDFYLLALDEDATEIVYATFFGGTSSGFAGDHVDGGTSRFSEDGTIYHAVCAACGGTNAFPVTSGVVSETNNSSNCNLGVFKFDFELSVSKLEIENDPGVEFRGCAPLKVDFKSSLTNADSVIWDFGDGTISNDENPTHIYTEEGNYNVRVIALSSDLCILPDTFDTEVSVYDDPGVTFIDSVICSSESTVIESKIKDQAADFEWSTGDTTQSISVNESGTYVVKASVYNCIYVDSFVIEYKQLNLDILKDTTLCVDDGYTIVAPEDATNIQWSTGETSKEIKVTESGQYILDFNFQDCPVSDTIQVELFSKPDVEIQGNTVACEGDTVTLEVSILNEDSIENPTIKWSSGESTKIINIDSSGLYSVEVQSSGCITSKSVQVTFQENLEPQDTNYLELEFCKGYQETVDFSEYGGVAEISWSDGDTGLIKNFNNSGSYLYIISNECDELTGEVLVKSSKYAPTELPMYFPNSFSPNNDGINDEFKPEYNPGDVEVLEYHMMILDKWGSVIYESFDPRIGWNGDIGRDRSPMNLYVYSIDIEFFTCGFPHREKISGDLQVIR